MATAGLDSYCPACLLPCATPAPTPAAPPFLSSHRCRSGDVQQQQPAELRTKQHQEDTHAAEGGRLACTMQSDDDAQPAAASATPSGGGGVASGQVGVLARGEAAGQLDSSSGAAAGDLSQASSEQIVAWVSAEVLSWQGMVHPIVPHSRLLTKVNAPAVGMQHACGVLSSAAPAWHQPLCSSCDLYLYLQFKVANHNMLFCFALSDYHHLIPIICVTCGASCSAILELEVFTSVMIAVLGGVRKQAHSPIKTSACSPELAICTLPSLC